MTPKPNDKTLARKGRRLALAIAGAGVLAIIAPWLVATLGLPARYEFLFYLIAMAVFFYAIVVSLQLWRARD